VLPNVISQANAAIYSHMPRVHPRKILSGSGPTLPRFDGVLGPLLERHHRLLKSSHATCVGTCGLTFELRGRPAVGRQARATENERPRSVARAWWHAVGPPLE
jgi:hypothetical protein